MGFKLTIPSHGWFMYKLTIPIFMVGKFMALFYPHDGILGRKNWWNPMGQRIFDARWVLKKTSHKQ